MKFAIGAAFGTALLSTAALAGAPEGTWMSDDGGTKVQIVNCGGRLCAKVVWLEKPIDRDTGKPKTDTLNPDPAKRTRPLIGLEVAHGMRPTGPNRWSGVIYNADDGHTYRAQFSVESERRAKLVGCVLRVLCEGHIWTRTE
jgi:uncharacterized protein (DUF2147 family)